MERTIIRRSDSKRDKTTCCVPQCSSRGSDHFISYHSFPPVNDPRRKQWILALKIGKPVTQRMKVCSRHFKNNDYILPEVPSRRPHLLKTAIPSLHLPDLSEDKKDTRKEIKVQHLKIPDIQYRQFANMPSYCSAIGCKNHATKPECQANNITFHPFPLKNDFLLKFWLIQMKREFFVPKESSLLCSEHFEDDCFYYEKGKRVIQPDAVPTKFSFPPEESKITTTPCTIAPTVLRVQENKKRKLSDDCDLRASIESLGEYENAATQTAISGISTQLVPSASKSSKSDQSSKDAEMQTRMDGISALLVENTVIQNELTELKKQVNRLTFSVEAITDDNMMKSLTGFSVDLVKAVFHFLCSENQFSPYAGLTPYNQFFIFLIYLRTGISQLFLSILFKTSQSSISRLMNTVSHFLYTKVKSVNIWPSREKIDKRTSIIFFRSYPNCRVILETVEFQIQRPTCKKTQILTYSPKKHTYTVKGLVGKTPTGGISYISDIWPGSISDRELFLKSGILDYLEENDLVVADKSFNIHQDLEERGCMLTTPKFLTDRIMLSEEELLKYPGSTHHRVHYDLATSKFNKFKFFEGQISSLTFDIVNEYFYIVAFLINFGNPLISIKQH